MTTRTALVTGGNRGIGLEIVKGIAKLGHKVLLAARDKDQAAEALEGLPDYDIHILELDLTQTDSITELTTLTKSVYGPVDILINNAGVLDKSPLLDTPIEAFENAFKVHVSGPLQLIQRLVPDMLENDFGRIVNVSSGWGAFNEKLEGPVSYAVSKAALNALTVKAAAEIDHPNVKINAMCPGWVHTRMGGKEAPRTPKEGAETAVWLSALPKDGPTGMFFRDRTPIKW